MRPILFNTPMVKALLNTKPDTWPAEPIDPSRPYKCQTRRVIELPPVAQGRDYRYDGVFEEGGDGCHYLEQVINREPTEIYLNIGKAACQVGDRLWVRETFTKLDKNHVIGDSGYAYKATTASDGEDTRQAYIKQGYPYRWKSPICMPRKAARLFLEVKEVRAERLQDITEADAKAEGASICFWFRPYGKPDEESVCFMNAAGEWEHPTYKAGFFYLWDSLNGKKGLGYENNPWVWVYEFMRVEG